MRDKICAVLLAAMLAAGLTARAADTGFQDVPDDAWYADAVLYCRDHGLMGGTSAGQFSPGRTMTRGMAAAVLYRMAGSPPVTGQAGGFQDVPAWCADAVAWAAGAGIATGYNAAAFGPGDPVTRQQMAVFLWRYSGRPDAPDNEAAFTDEAQIGSYALEAVHWARAAGVLNGYSDGTFRPRNNASRAHMAQILMNYGTNVPDAAADSDADSGTDLPEITLGQVLPSLAGLDPLCAPNGIAAMDDGSLLVTDGYYKVVWRVRNGTASVYAGVKQDAANGAEPLGGYKDAALRSARFQSPWAAAPFLDGWAVSDPENGAVRLLLSSGVSTINPASGASARRQSFQRPTGLAADDDGNLYVADAGKGTVQKVTPTGTFSTIVTGLSEPMGLCWQDGALYITESGADRVRVYRDGKTETLAGSGFTGLRDGPAAEASFSSPRGVTAAPDGTLYLADTANSAIRRIHGGTVETVVVRDSAKLEGGPVSPAGLLVQDGTLYICDSFARKVYRLPLDS